MCLDGALVLERKIMEIPSCAAHGTAKCKEDINRLDGKSLVFLIFLAINPIKNNPLEMAFPNENSRKATNGASEYMIYFHSRSEFIRKYYNQSQIHHTKNHNTVFFYSKIQHKA